MNAPVVRLGANSAFYILRDKQRSVRALLDASGAVRERYRYTAYGETIIDPASQQPPTGNRLAFQGHIYEPATGLYSMRARSYAPRLGRFLSPDPIGVQGGANLYAFANNRPSDVWDPFGLTPQSNPASDRMPEGVAPLEPCLGPYCESRDGRFAGLEQHAFEAEWGVPESAFWKNAPNSSYDAVQVFEPDPLNYANVPQGLRVLTGQEGSGMAGALRLQNDYANATADAAEIALDIAMLSADVATAGASPSGDLVVAKWAARAERLELFAPPRGVAAAERAIVPYFPANNGFLGATTETVLQTGQVIDRVGGSAISRFFSPAGTPLAARTLPPGTTGPLRAFEVLKPFGVESGTVAPAFGQLGFGTQFRSSLTLGELLEQGFIREIVP